MLRDPVQLLYSLHSQYLFSGHEDVDDFKKALELEEIRKQGRMIPDQEQIPERLFYREIVDFGTQIKRYFESFNRKNIQIIFFKHFTEKTSKMYTKVLQFLEVDRSFKPDFEQKNPNKKPRFEFLRDFLIYPPEFLRSLGRKFIPPNIRSPLIEGIMELNSIETERDELDEKLELRLRRELESKIEVVEELLDVSLDRWKV